VDLHCTFSGPDEFSDEGVIPFNLSSVLDRPIQVTARSKAWFCGSLLAGFEFRRGHGCLSPVSIVCVLSGRGHCDGPITRPGESYRLCVSVNTCNNDLYTYNE
jgi:hypothetical protein